MLLTVALNLEIPDSSSYGVNNSLVVQYTNTGTSNAPAPVLLLTADKANLWLPTDPAASGSSLQLLATNPDPNGPAGTLAPGASGSIVVDFTSTDSTDGDPIHFNIGQLTPGQTMDWSSVQSSMQPSYINSTGWNAVFANFKASVGGTTDSYQAALDADATYLAQLGEPTNDAAQLLAFEINKADNSFGAPPLGGALDISVPTPGLDLSFGRSFQSTVSGRNQTGLVGLGWTSNWDSKATSDAQGNVTISAGGGLRYFTKQRDGSYLSVLGDNGTLTAVTGGYQVSELDGSSTVFYANGKLNYVQDSNGNRITANYYTTGQLATLTESNGSKLTIGYNPQGFIQKITDPFGNSASYGYDSAGHLTIVTTPGGTTQYSYVTGTGTPADNALKSILNPEGTQLNYTYDSEGRLTGSFFGTVTNPVEPTTIGYLSPGGVTFTDANGNKRTVLYTDLGQAALITDPQGQTTKFSYDPSGDLTSAALPGGATYRYAYDLQGNMVSETDGLGKTTSYTYSARGHFTSYTDAKGNTTTYGYDANDVNLKTITDANGNIKKYDYYSTGEAKQFINARGQTIGYLYNTNGQLSKETFADGTFYSYGYDAHGNLSTATDAQNRITKFTYGGDSNNPNNPYLLSKVTYPDGTYLKFSYYAGGQRKQSVDQSGFTVNYTYDPATGRLTNLTDGSGKLITQYKYDPAGNLVQKDNGNGTQTKYAYYPDGSVKSITNLAADHTTINSFDDYTYDEQGNVQTDTNQDGQWQHKYDLDGQLTQAVFTPNGSDPDGLTAQNLQYNYDDAGNLNSQTVNGVTTTYVPDSVNEYKSSTTNGIDTTFQYDADGNLTSQTTGGVTTTYTFNFLSQLTGINGPDLKASYFYDPLGNRVSQTVNDVTTNFQIDPVGLGNVVAAFTGSGVYNNNSGGPQAHYTYGLGLVSQVITGGSAGYYDFNLTGNTVGISNATGSYVNKYSYLPFGQTTAVTTGVANPFTYIGQLGVRQDASNLFAMRAREYAPGTGQFLSNDPLGLAGGDANLRRYVGNNPMSRVDPEGTEWFYKQTNNGTNIYLLPGKGLRYEQTGTGETDFVPRGGWSHQIKAPQKDYIDPNTGLWVMPFDQMTPNTYNEAMNAYNNEVQNGNHSATGRGASNNANGSLYAAPSTSVSGAASYGPGYGPSVAPPPVVTPRSESEIDDGGGVPIVNGKLLTPHTTPEPTATTDNHLPPNNRTNGPFENKLAHIRVWLGTPPGGGSITKANVEVQFVNHDNSKDYIDFRPNSPQILVQPETGGQYSIWVDVTFTRTGKYDTYVTINHQTVITPDRESWTVYDAPVTVQPVNITVPAGQERVEVATFKDTGNSGANGASTYSAWYEYQGSGTEIPTTDITYSNGQGTVYADLDYSRYHPGPAGFLLVGVYDNSPNMVGQAGGATVSDNVTVASATQPPITTTIYSQLIAAMPGDPPLVLIQTTDPTITSASQVAVTLGPKMSIDSPVPLVTGVTLTHLANGVTQIEVDGVVSAVQPSAGPVQAVPLNIALGNEPMLTAQILVDETSSDYVVNPVTLIAVPGQPLQNVQVATVSGPANGAYSASIDWGDGETSDGFLTALGGGQFIVTGSKPHPYATSGMNTISVSVNGPGAIPASAAQTTATVALPDVGGGGGIGVGGGGGDDNGGGGGGGGGDHHPAPPHVPPLLAFLNSLFAAIEKMYGDHTTFTGGFFGMQLLDELYDDAGNLVSATLLGIDIKTCAEMIK